MADDPEPNPGLPVCHPDGNQDGPAALQNNTHIEHKYESLNSRSKSSSANAANAELTLR